MLNSPFRVPHVYTTGGGVDYSIRRRLTVGNLRTKIVNKDPKDCKEGEFPSKDLEMIDSPIAGLCYLKYTILDWVGKNTPTRAKQLLLRQRPDTGQFMGDVIQRSSSKPSIQRPARSGPRLIVG